MGAGVWWGCKPGKHRNKPNVTSRAEPGRPAEGPGLLRCQQSARCALPAAARRRSPLLKGLSCSHETSAPALGREKGKRSGARPLPDPGSRFTGTGPRQHIHFRKQFLWVRQRTCQVDSSRFCFPDPQAAGTEEPAQHSSCQTPTGGEAARLGGPAQNPPGGPAQNPPGGPAQNLPASSQRLPKPSEHLGPAPAAQARNACFSFLSISFNSASPLEGGRALPRCGNRENGFPQCESSVICSPAPAAPPPGTTAVSVPAAPRPAAEPAPHLDEGGAFLAARSSLGAAAGPGSHCACRLVPGIVLQHTTVTKEELHRVLLDCSKSRARRSRLRLRDWNAALQAAFPSAHAVYQAHRCCVLPTEKPPTPFTKQENAQGISSPAL